MQTQKWLNPQEAATLMGFKRKTLDNWRSEGRGPRYSRVGRSIRYRIEDIEDYMGSMGVMTDAA